MDMLQEQEIDLLDIVRVIKRQLRWIGICALIGVVGGFYSVITQEMPYVARSTIKLASISGNLAEDMRVVDALLEDVAGPIIKSARERMQYAPDKDADIAGNVKIKIIGKEYAEVSARGLTPQEAQDKTVASRDAIMEYLNNRVKTALDMNQREEVKLKKQLEQLDVELGDIAKKSVQREKTENLAQSNVFQALQAARKDIFEKRSQTAQRLYDLELDREYNTKPAQVVSGPLLPKGKIKTYKDVVPMGIIFGLLCGVLLAFPIDFFKRHPL